MERIGTLALALVPLTFCMRTTIPLRLVAIASSIAFIACGALDGLYPILGLHLVLLPLNLYRTCEMLRLSTTEAFTGRSSPVVQSRGKLDVIEPSPASRTPRDKKPRNP